MDVESTMLPLGTKLPEFNLVGIDEKNYKNVYMQSLPFCKTH